MSKTVFLDQLRSELERIDSASVSKRQEIIIEGFTSDPSPKAIIAGKEYGVFNSNDYLGLRHHPKVKQAEHEGSQKFGTGPGAVRFISGSLEVHRQLEHSLAKFHGRDDAIVFSSAFAANLATIFSLVKGQSKDSKVVGNVLVVSDELNHRSIIDGIRLANLPTENKQIFTHMNSESLSQVLEENAGKFDRVVVITDGVFSMLGEYQDLASLNQVIEQFDQEFPMGVSLIVDDCHGVAAFGETGRGVEEVTGSRADVLIGTLGKGFGADGGYVVADQVVIDYLRESAATYIYSNSISPGTAGAALKAVEIVGSTKGGELLARVQSNCQYLAQAIKEAGLELAAESIHPIQPLLIGDPAKTRDIKHKLFEAGFLVTNINYPVVPKGRDEIRIQVSAVHTKEELDQFVGKLTKVVASLSD